MNWLKENWFKVGILIGICLYLVSVYYGHYLDAKRHTLDVISAIRYCSTENFSQEGRTACANLAKQQLIFGSYFYKKEGPGFDEAE